MKLPVSGFRSAAEVIFHVGSHAGLLSSQFVKMVCAKGTLKMALTGLCLGESSLAVPDASADWTFYLDRRVLEAFLATTKAQTLDMSIVKDSLVLLAGRSKASSTPMSEVSGYASWKSKPTGSLKITDALRRELGVLSGYAPITAAADHLSAVYLIQKYGILATDSFVIAACIDPGMTQSFPLPVVISQLAAAQKVTTLDLDKQGAGIRFPEGYVYQTVSARCQTDYPIAAVQGVIKTSRAVPSCLKIKVGKLADALGYLKTFIFGSDIDINIQCPAGQKDLSLLLTMDLIRGRTQTASSGEEVAKDLNLKWPISKIDPWVTYIAGIDREQVVCCAFDPASHSNIMVASAGKRHYILIVAEMT